MRARKIGVLINPASAGGRAVTIWPHFARKLAAAGYKICSHTTRSEADFRLNARRFARNFRAIAICGGDSSLTIAAEELYAAKFAGELIFLPAGSVNDIALDIRMQRATRAAKLWLGDLCAADARKSFIGQANWGLGVVVNRQVAVILRKLPFLRPLTGILGFILIVLNHLARQDLLRARIDLGEKKIEGDYSIILATQIRHWAMGLRFAPRADWYAAELVLVAIRRSSLWRLLRIIFAAKTARHLDFPEVEQYRTRRIRVEFYKPTAVQVDGDILRDNQGELKSSLYTLTKKKSRFVLSLLVL